MSALRWAESILIQLPLRVGLGGLFAFAAFQKMNNVQAFAFAIKGFKVLDPTTHGNLIISAAYTLPWVEMIAGVMLIIGFKTRASVMTLGLMLVAFIAALLHVIYSPSIDADCSCFGDMNFICESTVGWCQVVRNLILLVPASYLLIRGGGILSLDTLIDPCKASQSSIHDANRDHGLDDSELRA